MQLWGTPGQPNTIEGAPTPPAIQSLRREPWTVFEHEPFSIIARVDDDVAVIAVWLFLQLIAEVEGELVGGDWQQVEMHNDGRNGDDSAHDRDWTFLFNGSEGPLPYPWPFPAGTIVGYYVVAVDNEANVSRYPRQAPAVPCLFIVAEAGQ